jgi:hypothetical protein
MLLLLGSAGSKSWRVRRSARVQRAAPVTEGTSRLRRWAGVPDSITWWSRCVGLLQILHEKSALIRQWHEYGAVVLRHDGTGRSRAMLVLDP